MQEELSPRPAAGQEFGGGGEGGLSACRRSRADEARLTIHRADAVVVDEDAAAAAMPIGASSSEPFP